MGLGYATRAAHWSIVIIIPIVMLGLLSSDLVLYYFSRKGNRFVVGFYNRIFKKRLHERHQWLERNVKKVIFFSRFLVQLRFLGPFFAGQTKVHWKTFVFYEILAMLIYVPLVVGAGWLFHNSIENIVSGINVARNLILIAVGLLLLGSLYRSVRRAFRKHTS